MKWVQKDIPKGLQIDYRGYIRVTIGKHKWKYLHRIVMERMLEETHPLTLSVMGIELGTNGKIGDIPEKWDVHHQNLEKRDCAPGNLLLLEKAIHGRAFPNAKGRGRGKKAIAEARRKVAE